MVRLLARTVEVYRAQLTVMLLALALIAGAALLLDNPLILEWHNAGGFFADPIQSVCGMALLTHQLGFFNILPLYVVLIGIAPLFVLVGRFSLLAALALSGGVYLASLVFEWNLPSWPGEGDWFFDPFCWQVLLVLGFVLQGWNLRPTSSAAGRGSCSPPASPSSSLGVVLAVTEIRPDPHARAGAAPAVHLRENLPDTGAASAFPGGIARLRAPSTHSSRHESAGRRLSIELGRNSLAVFSMGSILSLCGQLVRFQTGGGLLVDMLVAGRASSVWGLPHGSSNGAAAAVIAAPRVTGAVAPPRAGSAGR